MHFDEVPHMYWFPWALSLLHEIVACKQSFCVVDMLLTEQVNSVCEEIVPDVFYCDVYVSGIVIRCYI